MQRSKPLKRNKKHHEGKALVYARQYAYMRRQSALYQEHRFYKYGPEFSLIAALSALSDTVDQFNAMYRDTLSHKHGLLLLLIKYYSITHNVRAISPADIRGYYKSLNDIFGYFIKGVRSFRMLFNDLKLADFLNPLGKDYVLTTRTRLFSSMFEKNVQKLIETTKQEI